MSLCYVSCQDVFNEQNQDELQIQQRKETQTQHFCEGYGQAGYKVAPTMKMES